MVPVYTQPLNFLVIPHQFVERKDARMRGEYSTRESENLKKGKVEIKVTALECGQRDSSFRMLDRD